MTTYRPPAFRPVHARPGMSLGQANRSPVMNLVGFGFSGLVAYGGYHLATRESGFLSTVGVVLAIGGAVGALGSLIDMLS